MWGTQKVAEISCGLKKKKKKVKAGLLVSQNTTSNSSSCLCTKCINLDLTISKPKILTFCKAM